MRIAPTCRVPKKGLLIMVLGLAVMILSNPLAAQTDWQAGTDVWSNPANWTQGVPGASTAVRINNGGTAQISGGYSASSSITTLGEGSSESGTVTVVGLGSLWTYSNFLLVGASGTGTLTIADGGGVTTNSSTFLGLVAGSTGAVTVTGEGSQWTSTSGVRVGDDGTGTLTIADGGAMSSLNVEIGYETGSTGTATVTGAGSQWTNSNSFQVGNRGTGTLTIADGGAMLTLGGSGAFIGLDTSSTGTVTVTGAGSQWTNSKPYLYVGYLGAGTLNIFSGGIVQTGQIIEHTGTGTILFDGGTLRASVAESNFLKDFEAGDVMINSGGAFIDTNGFNIGISTVLGGAGGLTKLGAGTLTLTGANSYAGGTTINEGVLQIGNGGMSGSIVGDVTNNATLIFNRSNDITYSGAISGVGTLTKLGTGTLTLTGTNTYAGETNIRAGTLTVDGGSISHVNADTMVGVQLGDNGVLNIENGGVVSNARGYMGYSAGSEGTATVTGTNSRWTTITDFIVGYDGTGTLNIEAGGTVANHYGHIGFGADSVSTATVTDAGSTWTNSGLLFVGTSGTGTLNIEDGGTVTNTDGYIGRFTGSEGAVTVMGTNSRWTNSNDLLVGYGGTGTLDIQSGAVVSNRVGYIGHDATSSGTVTVTGTGSKWTNSSDFSVGTNGTGTLNIADGGVVENVIGYIGSNANSTGTATVTGAGSTWTNIAELNVGYNGDGTLNIEAGGTVMSLGGYIGYGAGSEGAATVTGTNSQWINFNVLYVGNSGDGTLNIEAGGTVLSNGGYIGYGSDSEGMATVTGAGSTWTTNGPLGLLYVGNSGTGTLNIEAGGTVTTTAGVIGYDSDSEGTATVTGAGSKWTNNAELYVGNSGDGTLNIKDGGSVSNTYGAIGVNTGSVSIATVTGAGSTWTSSSEFYVGFFGDGTLNIEAGGTVTNTTGYIGYNPDSTGTATVTGTNSRWTNSGALYMGYYGIGTLNIEAGAEVSNTVGYIGYYDTGSTGTVTVAGAGSKWTNSNDIFVGDAGTGTLNIADGGLVSVGNGSGVVKTGFYSGSSGIVNIGTGGAAGILNATSVSGGLGVAALNFNHTDADYYFTKDGTSSGAAVLIQGSTSVNHLNTGTTTFFGANTYTGNTTISAGTLRVNNTTGSGTGTGNVFVQNGGTLAGSGFISGAVSLTSGGRIAPGNSPGVLTVGSLDLADGGLLDFELGTSSDRIDITGLLTNTGGGLRTFNFSDAGGFALGTSYTLLTFGGSLNVLVDDFTGNSLLGVDPAFELLSNALLVTFFSTVFDGPIIQNSAPVGTSPFANFVVNGPVVTGGPGESNTINSLTFNPGSSLQVFNNLTVTNGNFTVNSGRAAINGGRVIVPGDFNKNGGGALVLNTFLQVGGTANINQGALFVNGTLAADLVHVFHGALLGGSGVIFGDVLNSGTVAPGNSPGTLTIIGNYTQTSIGTLQIEIASEKVFDRLVVSGTARLDGTLDIRNYHGNTLSYGQQVPFLQAGRIVGTFDEILMPEEDLFRGRFLNAGHTGILLVAPTSYTLVAETPNQTRVAQALDKWIGIEDGDIGGVTLALDLLTAEQYPVAFEAIMPGYYESALSTGIELSQSQGQLLFQQLSSRRLGARTPQPAPAAPVSAKGSKNVAPVQPQVAIADSTQWNGWMQGSGLFSDGGLSLNPGEDFDSGTFMVGADFAVSDHVSLGLFASYQEGWGDYDHGGDMDLESVRFGGYATFDYEGFYASGAVGGGTTDYSVERPIQWATLDRTARSDPDGTEFFTMLGTGYDFHAGNFTFGPSLSAQYTKLKLDEFTETGADSLDLRIRDAEEESLRTYLGGRIAYTVKVNDRFTVIPELRAFWEHEFLQGGENLNASLNGGAGPEFTYVTEEPGKDAMYVGAGLNFEFGEDFTTSVYYHANFGRNDDAQHTVSVSANWRF